MSSCGRHSTPPLHAHSTDGSYHFLAARETFLGIDFCRKSFGLHKRGRLCWKGGKSRERHKIASFGDEPRTLTGSRFEMFDVGIMGLFWEVVFLTENKVLAAAYFGKKVYDKLVESCQFHSILGDLSDDWPTLNGFDKWFISLPPFASSIYFLLGHWCLKKFRIV